MFAKGRQTGTIDAINVPRYSLLSSLQELTRNVKALSIGTVFGSIIGLIPGVGDRLPASSPTTNPRSSRAKKRSSAPVIQKV